MPHRAAALALVVCCSFGAHTAFASDCKRDKVNRVVDENLVTASGTVWEASSSGFDFDYERDYTHFHSGDSLLICPEDFPTDEFTVVDVDQEEFGKTVKVKSSERIKQPGWYRMDPPFGFPGKRHVAFAAPANMWDKEGFYGSEEECKAAQLRAIDFYQGMNEKKWKRLQRENPVLNSYKSYPYTPEIVLMLQLSTVAGKCIDAEDDPRLLP